MDAIFIMVFVSIKNGVGVFIMRIQPWSGIALGGRKELRVVVI
jgi:hypothetical protein